MEDMTGSRAEAEARAAWAGWDRASAQGTHALRPLTIPLPRGSAVASVHQDYPASDWGPRRQTHGRKTRRGTNWGTPPHCPGFREELRNLPQAEGAFGAALLQGGANSCQRCFHLQKLRGVRHSLGMEAQQFCWECAHTPTSNPSPKANRRNYAWQHHPPREGPPNLQQTGDNPCRWHQVGRVTPSVFFFLCATNHV